LAVRSLTARSLAAGIAAMPADLFDLARIVRQAGARCQSAVMPPPMQGHHDAGAKGGRTVPLPLTHSTLNSVPI
jgi:hypothetical protein